MQRRDTMYYVYRLYDAAGTLLYIGACAGWGDRLGQHLRRQRWGRDIARVDLEPHQWGSSAFDAERAAIAAERPLHNVQSKEAKRAPGEYRALILATLREHGPMTQTELERTLREVNGPAGTVLARLVRAGEALVVDERPSLSGRWVTTRVYGLPGQKVAA